MKKLILAALLSFIFIGAKAQEYRMVVQLTDGTEDVYSYSEDLTVVMMPAGIHLMDTENSVYTSYSFSDISMIYFKTKASLEDVSNSGLVFLYPNPTASSLKVAGAENQKVEIFSMDGRMVYSGMNTTGEINVSSLEKGVYAVKINGKTLKFSKL